MGTGVRLHKWVIGFLIFIAAIAALLFSAPLFLSAENFKPRITALLEDATQRRVHINGDMKFQLLPNLHIALHDVRIGNPAGFKKDSDMATIKEFHLGVALWPLINRRIVVDEFRIVEPAIYLTHSDTGIPNWEFTAKEGEKNARHKKQVEQAGESTTIKGGDLQLASLSITNGTVIYQESAKTEAVSFSPLDVMLELPSLHTPTAFNIRTLWQDTLYIQAEGTLDNLNQWLQQRVVALQMRISIGKEFPAFQSRLGKGYNTSDLKPGNNDFAILLLNGNIGQDKGQQPNFSGEFSAVSPSLARLSKHLPEPFLPVDMKTPASLNIHSSLDAAPQSISLKDLAVMLDDVRIDGSARVDNSGKRPSLKATLKADKPLMLDTYLGTPAAAPSGKAASEAQHTETMKGWSDDPILPNQHVFKTVDADIVFTLPGIHVSGMEIGALDSHTTLKDGVLNLKISQMALYGGTASVTTTLDASGKTITLNKNLRFDHMDVGALLNALGHDRLSGTGSGSLSLRTQGYSQQDWMQHLNGNGTIEMKNGAIRGINLAETIRNARSLAQSVKAIGKGQPLPSTQTGTGEQAKTDFAQLSGSFTVLAGVLQNHDLNMQAPLMTVKGDGIVNLPQQTVDYHLHPSLVGMLEGQERTQEAQGALTIPIRVRGSFDKLTFTPDAQNLLKDAMQDPEGTVKNLKENFKGFRKDVKSLFEGL